MIDIDKKWMKQAILEGFRSRGSSGKNPPVGCVIVQNNIIGKVLILNTIK